MVSPLQNWIQYIFWFYWNFNLYIYLISFYFEITLYFKILIIEIHIIVFNDIVFFQLCNENIFIFHYLKNQFNCTKHLLSYIISMISTQNNVISFVNLFQVIF